MPLLLLLLLSLPFSFAGPPVARVLTEDPPLPGEPLAGWEALSDPPREGGLTVEQAVALATERHPELAAARAGLRAAEGAWREARALTGPTGWIEGRPDGGVSELGLEVDLKSWVESPLEGRAASPEVEAARLRLEERAITLGVETRAAWYDHQSALAAWTAALRSVDALAAARDAALAIHAAGNIPASAVTPRAIAYEESRRRAAEREIDVIITRERLARLIGQDPGPLAPTPSVYPDAPGDLEAIAVQSSLALRALDEQIQAAQRGGVAARVGGALPEVAVGVALEPEGRGWAPKATLELTLPSPTRARGQTIQAEAGLERLIAERAQLEAEIRSEARLAAAQLSSATLRAQHVETVLLPQRERQLQEALLQYNAMQIDLEALLEAWRARVEAEAQLADTRREALTAAAIVAGLELGARAPGARPSRSASPQNPSLGDH